MATSDRSAISTFAISFWQWLKAVVRRNLRNVIAFVVLWYLYRTFVSSPGLRKTGKLGVNQDTGAETAGGRSTSSGKDSSSSDEYRPPLKLTRDNEMHHHDRPKSPESAKESQRPPTLRRMNAIRCHTQSTEDMFDS